MTADATEKRLRGLFREGGHEQVVAVAHEAARRGRAAELPADLPAALREALLAAGIEHLHGHQRAAFDALRAGDNVVISTGTASGKSLCYQLAVLDEYARDPQSRALLLFPTKALAQDQARKLGALKVDAPGPGPPSRRSTTATRRRTRAPCCDARPRSCSATPTCCTSASCPTTSAGPSTCTTCASSCSTRRTCTAACSAATSPRSSAACGVCARSTAPTRSSCSPRRPSPTRRRSPRSSSACRSRVVDEDQAPRPERTVVFWNPPLVDPARGERRSALAEASYVTAESVLAGARVIAFAPTRKAAELMYGHVRRRLEDRDPGGAAARVQPYRAGYTPQQRRDIERRLFAHELDAVIATQALELGIDVGTLDVSLVTGFPGTVTSLRQRWGRAGRTGHGWAVLVAGQDALDQYFMREPERLLSRGVEEAIIDLHNPHISARHLEAAAYERPLTPHDEAYFGEQGLLAAERLAQAGRLRRRGDGLVWARAVLPRRRHQPAHGLQRAVRHRRDARRRDHRHRRARARLPLRPPRRRLPAPRRELPRAASRPRGPHRPRGRLRRRLLHAGEDRQERADRRAGRHARAARRRPLLRRARGHRAGDRLPEARHHRPARHRHHQPRPARADLHHAGLLAGHAAADARAALARSPPPTARLRGRASATAGACTPPSTRSSPCCRCTRCATAGTSAA